MWLNPSATLSQPTAPPALPACSSNWSEALGHLARFLLFLISAPPLSGCASLFSGGLQVHRCLFPFAGDRLRQTENRATRCKVERLQLLLQQKRLRRKARRDARGPYHWPPSRKAGCSDSSSSGGGGSPSEASGLGLDFEDSVWKPEVNPDIQSEFVVA